MGKKNKKKSGADKGGGGDTGKDRTTTNLPEPPGSSGDASKGSSAPTAVQEQNPGQKPQGAVQQQAAWGPRPQGQSPQGSGQQQAPWGQRPQGQPPQGAAQQQAPWGQRPQGQPPQGAAQQQAAWGQRPQGAAPQQAAWGQRPQGQPPQGAAQQQAAWGQRPQGSGQQQAAWGQRPQGQPPQVAAQQQAAWGQRPQQAPQGQRPVGVAPQQAAPQRPQGQAPQQAAPQRPQGQASQQAASQKLPSSKQESTYPVHSTEGQALSGPAPPGKHMNEPGSRDVKAGMAEHTVGLKTKEPKGTEKLQAERSQIVSSMMENLSLKKNNKWRPKNPGPGTYGRKIQLFANHFLLTKIPSNTVYHYDVALKVDSLRTINSTMKGEIVAAYIAKFPDKFPPGNFVFDGVNNFYCMKQENDFNLSLNYLDPQNGREYGCSMEVRLVSQVDLSIIQRFIQGSYPDMPQDQLRIMDTVLKYSSSLDSVVFGRRIFKYQKGIPLGESTDLWFGWSNSVRPGWKCYVNIDISASAMYDRQTVLDFFHNKNFYMDREWDRRDVNRGAKEIRGLKIEMVVKNAKGDKDQKRVQRAIGLSPKSAAREEFTIEATDGKPKQNTTIQKYYLDCYGYRLKHPNLPCIHVGKKERRIYLPMELCSILPGQKPLAISDTITANMIRQTAKPPADRFAQIQNILKERNLNNDIFVKNFGMSVDSRPLQLTGRVLDPPELEVCDARGPSNIRPRDGVWDLRSKKYMKGGSISSWIVLNLAPRVQLDQIGAFSKSLVKIAGNFGLQMADLSPNKVTNYKGKDYDLRKFLERYFQDAVNANVGLIVVVLDRFGYEDVKLMGDCYYKIRTQCVKSKNVCYVKDQTLGNICLKINGKVGGFNNAISMGDRLYPQVLKECSMVLGADVTHPSPGQDGRPSIASVVASMNRTYNEYVGKTKIQKSSRAKAVEIIVDLKDMMKSLLKCFYSRNGTRKPKNLIMFRDGVSEGQYDQVLAHELQSIQKACLELEPNYEPKITYVVVGKRHHTRFCPVSGKDGVGRAGNIPPGTVVDHEITHPSEFDFFLCSHAGIQGTSRPCHYYVIYDDGNFKTQNEIQVLAYYLCHVYARCTRAVSIPAPTYYAHLAAFRARQHMKIDDDASSMSSGSSDSYALIENPSDSFMYFL